MDRSKGVKIFKRGGSLMKTKLLGVNIRDENKVHVATAGYFPIYVGPGPEMFVIKIEHVNHRLFKTLLEEAKLEYGYHHKGPLVLPCPVDHFANVLMEIDFRYCDQQIGRDKGCNFVARTQSSYHFLTRRKLINALARLRKLMNYH